MNNENILVYGFLVISENIVSSEKTGFRHSERYLRVCIDEGSSFLRVISFDVTGSCGSYLIYLVG